MRAFWMGVVLAACGSRSEPCDCPDGFGVQLDSQCACLVPLAVPDDPAFSTTFHVDADATGGTGSLDDPWPRADWDAIDAALQDGDVHVVYDPTDVWDERLDVHRTDTGPGRVVLDGGGAPQRATVPGVHTGYDAVARHRVTVRGFDITGSRDKGVYWVGGDGVVIEDNLIHANRGSPAVTLEYSRRTGLVSRDFVVRNNHVYDQVGECVYIGGAEGADEPSHVGVRIENNLVHGCRDPFDTRHDGINIKDRLTDVVVRRNVVVGGDWGFELASQGTYSGNISIDADREGFHVSDGFQALPDVQLLDNVSIGAGDEGMQLTADRATTGRLTVVGLTVAGSDAGVAVGGSFDVDAVLDEVAVVGSGVAFDGWGQGPVQVVSCASDTGTTDHARQFEGTDACARLDAVDLSRPAGADGVFFTPDDPWIIAGGAQLERGAQSP